MTTTQTKALISQWQAWLLAARPKTLTASLIPVLAGTALANGSFGIALFALLTAICIQIGTNLINDALDFAKGTDTKERLGPQRVTQSGLIPQKIVYFGGLVTFAIGLLCSLPLMIKGGWPIVLLMTASIACGYLYTGGPKPLSYLGVGDIFVILFYGLASTMAVAYLQSGKVIDYSFIAGLQIGFLATVLIAINNLRDCQGDAKANKLTIPVRFGVNAGRIEISCMALLPFLLNIYWFYSGYQLAAILPFLTLPLAIKIVYKIWKTYPGRIYNDFLGQAALLHLLFGILLTIGFYGGSKFSF